ncbi:uncharacterized protein LOC113509286 isoform X2 [Galleria mellonella]|uniref:Uncharacterized protein LOC113509286 isoform X2 n=1 Tax=Galleria mellonella TaxID=7137 RepID=A0A6J3C0A3_GALME|nr:uncharacterized protein LOC113509286 isoform X2 [Galleria mellonella]
MIPVVSDTSSSGKPPRKPLVTNDSDSRRRSHDFFSRRIGSSAVSLHLPSTSGHAKQPLSAHRSHEEIRSRRKSHHEVTESETRYHSAPSVIDEVLHRRDWERSTKDLHIPLKPDAEHKDSDLSLSTEIAPRAEPELSSPECNKTDEHPPKTCKKHYTNIKSSRGRKDKESYTDDIKDTDATELSNFYIGDTNEATSLLSRTPTKDDNELFEERTKAVYRAKEAKQSLNESIKSKDRPRQTLIPLEEHQTSKVFNYWLEEDVDQIDRSGAMHHNIESRVSMRPYPPPSVETVGYEGGACYLAEVGSVSELRARPASTEIVPPGAMRARHASDGDILAPPQRPESGAFSESDLDLELEESEERPPEYHELQLCSDSDRKETAI